MGWSTEDADVELWCICVVMMLVWRGPIQAGEQQEYIPTYDAEDGGR